MEKNLLARAIDLGGNIGGGTDTGLGPFGNFANTSGAGITGGTAALTSLTQIISRIIGIMTIAAAIFFMFHLLVAGFRWIGSEGDKHKLEEAQNRITNSFIGLIIVAAGWAILALAGQFIGFDPLIRNPGTFMQNLQLP